MKSLHTSGIFFIFLLERDNLDCRETMQGKITIIITCITGHNSTNSDVQCIDVHISNCNDSLGVRGSHSMGRFSSVI